MKVTSNSFCARALLAGVFVSLVFGGSASAVESGFRDIFDGRSLSGWKGDAQYWRVEGGAIVGEIPAGQRLRKNHWLIWEGGVLRDFELRVQFRLTGAAGANSGIQVRCQAKSPTEVAGYQADLDMGATWLGRIYDEHGRALLVERGARVEIAEDGKRRVESFADAKMFATLFRENEWNDYRIRACGEHMSVEINGTLFSELIDRQKGQQDLEGQLAFQLHAGPETKIEFRAVRVRELKPGSHKVKFKKVPAEEAKPAAKNVGVLPRAADGRELNLGFEDGTLRDWTLKGEAFKGQPLDSDDISSRWAGQTSGKDGTWFIGGFEKLQDKPTGTLESVPFKVTHPYAGFRIGGGSDRSTRVEIVLAGKPGTAVHTATGANKEQMRPVFFDLRPQQGKKVFIRLVDENPGGWGHLNFDDFRFYTERPAEVEIPVTERHLVNPILAHLEPNPTKSEGTGSETVGQMRVVPGFAVDLIAAEPRVHQPIAFTFDERGRIWVVEGHSYPQKRPKGEGLDRIVIFSDEDGDGSFETRKVFSEKLNLVSGLEVGHGGVWVGAAPELLFIPDRDGDDRPDGPAKVLLDGFGYQDTHETLNSFIWGPDGWLYGNQGVFNYARIGKPGTPDARRIPLSAGVWRYHPTRHEFEVFAYGGSNQWGLDFNSEGQLFMTQCRSRWGGGPINHVIQGGHFWNQANRGYADFVSSVAPTGYPFFKNYLMASARYGHGEGGAGKRGSRAVYGGHSHVGTMIYLGDNWPEEFRNRLFTHNLHGHQMNQVENRREGSGYNSVHAGRDLLHCADPTYVTVDLKYGPDGAVYFTDWSDRQHCHNPNMEIWDRGNGRIYRMAHVASFKPAKADLTRLSDAELVKLQSHRNAWYARTARRLLQERAVAGKVKPATVAALRRLAVEGPDHALRLNGLWALNSVGGLGDAAAVKLLGDESEFVRAWTIQLLTDDRSVSSALAEKLVAMAKNDPSALTRLYLASAMQRVPSATAWRLGEALAARAEDAEDRNLPSMIWFGLAPLVKGDLDRAFALAGKTAIPALRHYVRWYAAKSDGAGLERVLGRLGKEDSKEDGMVAVGLALSGQRGLPMPKAWPALAKSLYADPDDRIRALAEQLGGTFGDKALFPILRTRLADRGKPVPQRRRAFDILAGAGDAESAGLFLSLLDEKPFRMAALQQVSRFNHPKTAEALLNRFEAFGPKERTAAMTTLTSRAPLANALLDAIVAKKLDRKHLSAFFVRQLTGLKNPEIDRKLGEVWGKVAETPAEIAQRIADLDKKFSEAPLWAFNAGEGKKLFQQLCLPCHRLGNEGVEIGPNLAGSGANGARYFLENILDPNAVIGNDYQLTEIETRDDESISGIVIQTTDTAVTIRTLAGETTVPTADIAKMTKAENSMMPIGLLDAFNERQIIELLKYLTSLR